MNRKLLTLLFCFLSTTPAYADFESLTLEKSKQMEQELSFSPEFMAHIKSCTPSAENKKARGIDATYEIKGLDNEGNCQIISTGSTNGIIIRTACKFDEATLQIWHEALTNLKQTFKTATSVKDIMSSPDYWIAASIFMDEKNCKMSNQEFDPSKELREHLKDCKPYNHKEYIELSRTTAEYTIIGKQDNKCLFQQKITQQAPSANDMQNLLGAENYDKIKDMLRSTTVTTNCKFSESMKNKYITLLAQTAVPSGSITNMEQMFIDTKPFQNVTDFLLASPQCQTDTAVPH